MMQLQRFDFRIVYKKGKDMHIADTLSRAQRATSEQHPFEKEEISVLKVSFIPTDRLCRLGQTHCRGQNLPAADFNHQWRLAKQTVPLNCDPTFWYMTNLCYRTE